MRILRKLILWYKWKKFKYDLKHKGYGWAPYKPVIRWPKDVEPIQFNPQSLKARYKDKIVNSEYWQLVQISGSDGQPEGKY